MSAVSRRLVAVALVTANAGCQLAFPLPDEATGGSASSTRSSAATESTATESASSGLVACGTPECSTYCTEVEATCAASPQYHTSAECCAICATWDATARDCRAPAGGDPLSCTHAGPFGGRLACADQCAELCATYRAICGAETPSQCEEDCATKWPGLITFDACRPEGNDTRSCRMSRILEATVEADPMRREEACKRAKDGKCMGMGMGMAACK